MAVLSSPEHETRSWFCISRYFLIFLGGWVDGNSKMFPISDRADTLTWANPGIPAITCAAKWFPRRHAPIDLLPLQPFDYKLFHTNQNPANIGARRNSCTHLTLNGLGQPMLNFLPSTVIGILSALLLALNTLLDRKSTRLNSSHVKISYAVFCL